MAIPVHYGFLGENKVSLSINPAFEESHISASTVYALNLPCPLNASGCQFSSVRVEVPTVGGFYASQMNFAVSYGLPSDVLLGSDWTLPCQPLFIDNRPSISDPTPENVRALPPPHSWQLMNGPFLSLRAAPSPLIL